MWPKDVLILLHKGISCSHPPPLQIISFFSAATRGGVCSFKWQKFCASQLPRVLISDLQKLFFSLTKLLKMAAISFVRGGEGEGLQYSSWRESIFQQRDNFKVFSLKSFLYSQKKEMVCSTAVGENLYFNSWAFFLDLSRCHELSWKSTDIKHFNHFADLSCVFLLTFIQCYC